ncbi:hypothetical protein AB0759_00980, partial [Scytonema tolypothrichoides VB-61278_2]
LLAQAVPSFSRSGCFAASLLAQAVPSFSRSGCFAASPLAQAVLSFSPTLLLKVYYDKWINKQ